MDEEDKALDELIDTEPKVTSKDPHERKLARKLRIERRLEAIRRQKNMPETVTEVKHEEKSNVQQQLEKSAETIKKLLEEGEEVVTNVRVANDYREIDRREAEGIGREKIIAQLEEEATKAEEAFNEIANKWTGILKYQDPIHINDDLIGQKDKCDELIRQKDGVIAMLRENIAEAETKFARDQRKQIDDINILSQRIEKQITLMRRAYREELKLIEESMMLERHQIMEINNKKWEELAKFRDSEEISNSDKKFEQLDYFENQMTTLRLDFQERFRETKISLEQDCEKLELELEQIKALAILNSEKLDYNYQILKKREDENIIIKSQQKRRINKLQDVVNTMRRKINQYDEDTKVTIKKLTAEVLKLHQNIVDIEQKADHFAVINDEKFNHLWDLNRERASKMIDSILIIDKILHEQQLGIEWNEKEINRRKNIRKDKLISYKNAMRILEEKERDKEKEESTLKYQDLMKFVHQQNENGDESDKDRLLKRLFKQISLKTNFLIEDRLQEILLPYAEDQQTLIRIDNVFSALNIRKAEDMNILLVYFLPYTFCSFCNKSVGVDKSAPEQLLSEIELFSIYSNADLVEAGSQVPLTTVHKESNTVVESVQHTDLLPNVFPNKFELNNIFHRLLGSDLESLHSEADSKMLIGEYSGPSKDPGTGTSGRQIQETKSLKSLSKDTADSNELKMTCNFNHPLTISPVYVLKALRQFVSFYFKKKAAVPTITYRLQYKRHTICRLVNENDIRLFWSSYRNVFTKDNENIWNALLKGLKKYHAILINRKFLNDEVVRLRKENTELKQLLENYMENSSLKPLCRSQKSPI